MKIKYNNKSFKRALLVGSIALATTGCIDDVDKPVTPDYAPEISSIDAQSLVALTNYTYTVSASDANSEDIITLSATELPEWLSFDAATGVLSGMPGKDDTGEHTVTITASDGELETSQSFTITVSTALTGSEWSMVWSDEFDGSSLNDANWTIETGDGSQYGITAWGNEELEWYSADNITVADGNLVITAKEEASNGYDYTSGRMRTDTKVDIKYGRIEARVKTPVGQGLWSAFWMLPTDSQYGGWASGGEIDIMEVLNVGTAGSENVTHGNLHYGMAWPLNVASGTSDAEILDLDDFHVYALEWEQNEMRWYIDGLHFKTVTSASWWSYYNGGLEEGYVSAPAAPFNEEFHILLNLAVGGTWPGSPDENTVFPAEMMVDYVRVYECDSGEPSGVGCANNVNSTVEAPAADAVYTASYSLFDENGLGSLSWDIVGETVVRELNAAVAWDNGGIAVVEQVGEGDHANVLDITTADMGNVAISATDGEAIALFGMGNNPEWWRLGAGELKFDLYIDSAVTPEDSSISFKMDSGWPAVGSKTLAVADLPKDTWTTLYIPVNDLIATSGDQPLDTSAVMNLFIVEFSAAAHVQLDNISLICGHKDDGGCGISPPAVEIEEEIVEVFTDAVNDTLWTNGIGAWGNGFGADYYEGDTDNHVNWALIESGEDGHDTVVEVTFNADGNDGVFYFQSAQPVDMSSLNAGSLIFDIKVTDYGSNTSGFVYKVDCTDPCSTGDQTLGVVGDGEWETITLPVATLIGAGLDTTKVNAPLVLFPTWGDQQGVIFQVDNVRWEKAGTDTGPEPGPDPDPEPQPEPGGDPLVGAPVPSAVDVISVFSDSYTAVDGVNTNPGWGQSTITTEIDIDGNTTLKMAGLNYQGIEYSTQDVSGKTSLHLDYWTADATSFEIYLISTGPAETSFTITTTQNGWQSVDIPLSTFSGVVDLADAFQFKFVGSGTIYVDNLFFH